MISAYKDPINYIFKIVKYIIEKDSSHNTENVVKALGKCVGNKLRGEKYNDMKLLITRDWITTELINILSITDIIISIDYNLHQKFHIIKFYLNNNIIKLQINLEPKFNCLSQIYFTCDNLALDINGTISNITQSISKTYDLCESITCSITHAITKKFSIINLINTNKENIALLIDINKKYNKMINQGYIYIAKSNDIIFKNYKDIALFCERDISTSCAICCNEYCEKSICDTVLLKCLHDFHIDCLHTWIKKNNNKCPLCRSDIDFEPQTKYGDNMIDNIIENFQEENIELYEASDNDN